MVSLKGRHQAPSVLLQEFFFFGPEEGWVGLEGGRYLTPQ